MLNCSRSSEVQQSVGRQQFNAGNRHSTTNREQADKAFAANITGQGGQVSFSVSTYLLR